MMTSRSIGCVTSPDGRSSAQGPSPILAIAAGPTTTSATSASMPWTGFLLEKHLSYPGERLSASIDRPVISMFTGQSAWIEYRGECGRFEPSMLRTGMIIVAPPGNLPDIRIKARMEMIHCALEQSFVDRIIDEMDCPPVHRPTFRAGIRDRSIQHILGMLMDELASKTQSGRLYVESLAHALAVRYLLLDRPSAPHLESRVSGLPLRLLNRVRERIEANLDADLSLESLAEEAGYSRAHFLRMFRVATGCTPHQYVLDLRLRRAQECLRMKNSSMIDIALSCGFSSQSHMTSVFRQRLEMTPGEFRRDLKNQMDRGQLSCA